jgi:hypothetical protein
MQSSCKAERLHSWNSLGHGALGSSQGFCLRLLGGSDRSICAGTRLCVAAGVVPAATAATGTSLGTVHTQEIIQCTWSAHVRQ